MDDLARQNYIYNLTYVKQEEIIVNKTPKELLDEAGYVLADESTKTNIPGVFAVGDMRQKPLRQIVTAVADGAVASKFAEEYVDGTFVYANNIQLDSTLINAEDKIRQQIENATILTVQFYSDEYNLDVMLYACYILPEETIESYKTISNNLYHYYSDKFSYILYGNTDNLSQEYSWYGFIDEKEYNNKDEHYTYIFNKGAITKEEYDKKISRKWKEFEQFVNSQKTY